MKDLIYRQDAIDALDVNNRFADARCPEWYVDAIEQVPSAQPQDGSDCPFHKRWGIECDDGYSVCTIVQRLKGEEDFNG